MTVSHLVRSLLVAGFACAALAFATQVRAEQGDNDVMERFQAAEAPAAADASEPAASPSLPEEKAIAPKVRSRLSKIERRIGDDPARAAALRPLIAKHAAEHGVPFALADAVVRVESRYNAAARHGPNLGLTQINPRTARGLGYAGSDAGLFDPETNLRFGIKYLAQAYRLADGDTCGTVLRYQAGHGARAMTKAARVYCSKVKTIFASVE